MAVHVSSFQVDTRGETHIIDITRQVAGAVERIAPREGRYEHNQRWGDGNGYAHVRASFIGQGRCFPVRDGAPALGTWQQIILVDFDNRPRTRDITVQIIS